MGILEKISEIEKEIARTQKNKATEYHLGLLKAKLAKYRAQLLEPSKSSSKGEGFDVMKSGDARVALIGFPSVGKAGTGTRSRVPSRSRTEGRVSRPRSHAASSPRGPAHGAPSGSVPTHPSSLAALSHRPALSQAGGSPRPCPPGSSSFVPWGHHLLHVLWAQGGLGGSWSWGWALMWWENRLRNQVPVSTRDRPEASGTGGPLLLTPPGGAKGDFSSCSHHTTSRAMGWVPCVAGPQRVGFSGRWGETPAATTSFLQSTFLSLMTSTASEAASYEFTTLTCIPGVIEYKGANIQLLDLPGIIEGAAQGKGRGRQVIAVARTADVVVMMLDATKGEVQRSLLEKELESVGIRLNKHKPNIYFRPKKGGGISFNSTVTLTQCSEKLVQLILHEYKIFNAEVLFREDCSPDEFIDVIVGNRVYMPCLYVYNKIDQISMEEVDRLARKPDSVVISCGMRLNLDYLLEMLWEYLALTCIYTKKRGQRPDFTDAIILRKGASVEHVCHRIHRSLASQFKYALVWGTSTKYSPQRVGLTHALEHEDVIQIVKK
ncbi:developmentally-regulated GTP-binding protein 2 isoform X2 [Hippopotamus amphibius kiboko]|uniref:developmentally-regulated GTP-binding protein 2 isoform X2 n=1 Tax=Hippopotamus amphibius kiboko TaxID=575201 RepID=UPI002591F48C|nr:developmentally-regulated GTP-binding protein 2 isoform X2 [Hippopotamus amphibius kiboko]